MSEKQEYILQISIYNSQYNANRNNIYIKKPIIIFRHKTHNSIIKNPNTNIDNNNVPANFPLSSMTTLS